LFCERQHAASAASRVINGADDACSGQRRVVVGEQQLDDQADHFARGEMLPGGFVRDFREAADQILEQVAHFDVGDLGRVQVDGAEALEYLPEDATIFQSLEG